MIGDAHMVRQLEHKTILLPHRIRDTAGNTSSVGSETATDDARNLALTRDVFRKLWSRLSRWVAVSNPSGINTDYA